MSRAPHEQVTVTREPDSHPEKPSQPAVETTVEAEVRATIAESMGGLRGSLETALPLVAFTVAYVITNEVQPGVIFGVGTAVVLYGLRLVQNSTRRFVYNGLFSIALGALIASATGRGEAAFLPGIISSAAWAFGLGLSILLRWPLAGFLIGAVLGHSTDWRNDPGIVRLSNRLTIVFLVPMIIRVVVQYPLYLAGDVAWLGISRLVLGWPMTVVTLAAAGLVLARGHTPLHRPPGEVRSTS